MLQYVHIKDVDARILGVARRKKLNWRARSRPFSPQLSALGTIALDARFLRIQIIGGELPFEKLVLTDGARTRILQIVPYGAAKLRITVFPEIVEES